MTILLWYCLSVGVNCDHLFFPPAHFPFHRRAVDLCFALINSKNVRTMVKELLTYVEHCDAEFKGDVCSSLSIAAEKYAPNKRWHLDTMLNLLVVVSYYSVWGRSTRILFVVVRMVSFIAYLVNPRTLLQPFQYRCWERVCPSHYVLLRQFYDRHAQPSSNHSFAELHEVGTIKGNYW